MNHVRAPMTDDPNETVRKNKKDWVEAELEETLDETLEAELSEPMLSEELRQIYKEAHPDALDRRIYLKNLLQLQAELIKMQSWVEATGAKVLIIFEGRDSAGKGGASSNASRSASIPAPPALSRCRSLRRRSGPSGTSSAMSRTCPRAARSCCSTAPGTTAPASSA
jgi:hypothetical protein